MAALTRLTLRALATCELRTTLRFAPLAASKVDFISSRGFYGPSQNLVRCEPKKLVNTHQLNITRRYSRKPPASKAEIVERVLKVCKAFDKITSDSVTLESHFISDLGLDSLDHVELLMAIEDEFGFEIPDDQGEKLLTPQKLVEFIGNNENVLT